MNYQKLLLVMAIAAIAGSTATSVMAQSNQTDTGGTNTVTPNGNNSSFFIQGGTVKIGANGQTSQGQTSDGSAGDRTFEISGLPSGFNLPSGIIDIITAATTGSGSTSSTNGDTGIATNPDLETAMGTRRATGDFSIDGNGDSSTSSTEGNLPDGDSQDNANNSSNCESDLCIAQQADEIELTFNEIAELIETDLEQSIEQLAAAEATAQQAEDEPRRIARRRSLSEDELAMKSCPNPKFAAAQARKTVQDKLDNSKMFIEQMKLIDPNSNIW